uniref:Uncharacterized protein n=1 Tax=Anguilla anguilla TaxID=7936 RepID=A0A0E9RMJ1_ANGAN
MNSRYPAYIRVWKPSVIVSHLLRGNTPVPSLLSAGHFVFPEMDFLPMQTFFYQPRINQSFV